MKVPPSQSEVFLLSEQQRRLVPDGPAIIDAQGNRHEVPPKVVEALLFVETAMREGFAVQVTVLRHELPLREAAAAIDMAEDELRSYVDAGEVPFKRRLKARQREILDQMLAESDYDDAEGIEPGDLER
jgi:hypothetical protein